MIEKYRPLYFLDQKGEPTARLAPDERMFVYGASQMSLWKPEGLPCRRFLLDERKIDVSTIADFRLGYVPFSVNHPFAGRIVMPIHDAYSNLVALSVRPNTNDKVVLDEVGKYWNESYPKGEHLYGFDQAKLSIVRYGFAIVVEGQMDVLSMHSFGFTNCVGVLGGAFTPMQAMLLKRWTDQIVIMFDGDVAGQNHTTAAMLILKEYGYKFMTNVKSRSFKVTQVKLPMESGTKDPNDFLKRFGSWPMRERLATSMSLSGLSPNREWN